MNNNITRVIELLTLGLAISFCILGLGKIIYLNGYIKALRFAQEKSHKAFGEDHNDSVQLANDILRVMKESFESEIDSKEDHEKAKIIEIWNKVNYEIGPRLQTVIKARQTIEELEMNRLQEK